MSEFYKACQTVSAQFWAGRCVAIHNEALGCYRESRATRNLEVCSDWIPNVEAAEEQLRDRSQAVCVERKVAFQYPVDRFISCEPIADSKRVETQSALRYRASELLSKIAEWFRSLRSV